MEDPRFWLDAVQLLLTIGVGLYAWLANRHRATREQIDKLRKDHEARLVALSERLIRAEAELEDKPTAKALHELALAISHFGGDLKAVVARLDGMAEIVGRLEKVADRQESYLLNNGGRK